MVNTPPLIRNCDRKNFYSTDLNQIVGYARLPSGGGEVVMLSCDIFRLRKEINRSRTLFMIWCALPDGRASVLATFQTMQAQSINPFPFGKVGQTWHEGKRRY